MICKNIHSNFLLMHRRHVVAWFGVAVAVAQQRQLNDARMTRSVLILLTPS